MRASKYERRHVGPVAEKILAGLMKDHGCIHHAGANSGACLACFRRTDLVCDILVEDSAEAEEVFNDMWSSGDWEGQVSIGFAASFSQELDMMRQGF